MIVPAHHDNFFKPLAAPMAPSFNVRVDRFFEEVARVSESFAVRDIDRLVRY